MFANLRQRFADDRGDVPGWVLITLMTAGTHMSQKSSRGFEVNRTFASTHFPFGCRGVSPA